ncbi:peptidoglycan editing factor PgeF [Verminephrobacter aporrectodeae]|uniref:peptidoglycan editing factor PgeF n=1 Tax=Verminephrobacter aporrectodeae TaxID=1110389 RepID=UPI002243153A|nr:peptidoglycan editing factor PgeF [Verminephrobacter aporrectodeae]MCW8176922.1 peptidoglycan editing factor PgeF [Verminephrobacter aporrectodeae subsp. tuberculatae]MCW8204400.1 peptidoglycan editing factor PgeF [Verminephrobacter aporrectodeae subsp. tuberculatae]
MTEPQADWLVPDWHAPPGVHALCTTRAGGVSLPPYDSLNLGDHVGDDGAAVQANRRTLQTALQARTPAARAVFLRQVHGVAVARLDSHSPDGIAADACVSRTLGTVCTILVADCLPVLLAHRSGAVVAAAHAGWRGLAGDGAQGVLESVFRHFCALVQAPHANPRQTPAAVAADTLAWLGPCIGARAFEVGAEVRSAFCGANPAAQACFAAHRDAPGKYLCDLAGLARLRLHALGITALYGNDGTPPWCTVSHTARFFSHRRGAAEGGSGRLAACIWRG